MLHRLRIRSKLLLLLLIPLAALTFFSVISVMERIGKVSDAEDQVARAELASTSSALALAVQSEQLLSVATGAGMSTDLLTAQANTTEAYDAWEEARVAVKIDSDGLAESIDSVVDSYQSVVSLRARLESPDSLSALSVSAEFVNFSRALDTLGAPLAGSVDNLQLYRGLSAERLLGRAQQAMSDINVNGAIIIDQYGISYASTGAPSDITDVIGPARRVALENATQRFDANLDLFEAASEEKADMVTAAATQSLGLFSARFNVTNEIVGYATGTTGGLEEWVTLSQQRLQALTVARVAILDSARDGIQADATTTRNQAIAFITFAIAISLLAMFVTGLLSRSVSEPLRSLTSTARNLAEKELPALVERLRSGDTQDMRLTQIDVTGKDEIAELATAVDSIQRVTFEVAREQGELLRRGIGDIFVNLARRNQSLLDRQIDFIDQLESREENPDQLENLFRLDHLATRMRRNAESLLVLAGSEPTRRRGQPVAVADVVRVAMGEIEDYSRINLLSIDEATVAGTVAVDLAHLLSELMENATQFSPPDTSVEVVGRTDADGGYLLSLTDQGIGMTEEQLAVANETLTNPPLVGLDLSRSLGFTVVSRLANRLGVLVKLVPASAGGLNAMVSVPPEMIGRVNHTPALDPPSDTWSHGSSTPEIAVVAEPVREVRTEPNPLLKLAAMMPSESLTEGRAAPRPPEAPSPTPSHSLPQRRQAPQPEALSELAALDAPAPEPEPVPVAEPTAEPTAKSLPPLPQRTAGATPAPVFTDAPVPPVAEIPKAPVAAAVVESLTSVIPEPVHAEPVGPPPTPQRAADAANVDASVTAAGLIRRTPRQVQGPPDGRAGPATMAGTGPEQATGSTNRSPEQVRQMLSRYRAGLHKGRTTDGPQG